MRAYPLGIDAERPASAPPPPTRSPATSEELLRRRREHLIIRVDRADLSKNVLRGFTAFDVFLQQHPEFRERVTFIAHLQPSRQDVPEYAEYLERIEALVAVVNHRHGTTDWMPIDLRIYENFHEAVARYKHYDLLIVNSIFDGMNLVAKEAPAVNTRDGVVMLSENTGSHEELGDCTLTRQPVRHPGAGRHDPPGADDGARGAPPARRPACARSSTPRDPGVWIDEQLADIDAKRGGVSPLVSHRAQALSAVEAELLLDREPEAGWRGRGPGRRRSGATGAGAGAGVGGVERRRRRASAGSGAYPFGCLRCGLGRLFARRGAARASADDARRRCSSAARRARASLARRLVDEPRRAPVASTPTSVGQRRRLGRREQPGSERDRRDRGRNATAAIRPRSPTESAVLAIRLLQARGRPRPRPVARPVAIVTRRLGCKC